MINARMKRLIAISVCLGTGLATQVAASESTKFEGASDAPRYHLRATPETVIWGYMGPDVPPVLKVESGAVVDIDTFSSVGVPLDNPKGFFEQQGIAIDEKVQPLIDIMTTVKKDVGPHILTGPIEIDGAQPGDLLEVRILHVEPRAPHYGVSFTAPGVGTLTDLVDKPWMKVLPLDMDAQVARFDDSFDIPLAPFMGTMGVLPTEKVSSVPPGPHGGNIDMKDLVPGSRLYLPVHVPGAGFLTGDGHAAQGDGEVNLTGLEVSQNVRVQFILHKDCKQPWPLAETDEHYIVMGLDEDLDEAARLAVAQAVDMISQFGQMPKTDASPRSCFTRRRASGGRRAVRPLPRLHKSAYLGKMKRAFAHSRVIQGSPI